MPIAVEQEFAIGLGKFSQTFSENLALQFEQFVAAGFSLRDPLKRQVTQPEPILATPLLCKAFGHISNDRRCPLLEMRAWFKFIEFLPEHHTGFLDDVIRIRTVSDDGKTGGVEFVVGTLKLTQKVRFS